MTIDNESLMKVYKQQCYKSISGVLNNLRIYAILKGEPLSFYTYGRFGCRKSSDIDILIPRKSLQDTEKLLSANGFKSTEQSRLDKITMLSSSHQVPPWIKDISPWGIVNIDLNFDIFWGEYEGRSIDIEDFLSDTVEMDIYGCKVKTLPPLKAMIQLILHHYKDMNSIFLLATRKSIKYDMFKDVYYLLTNNREQISLNKLYDLSNTYDIIPYVFYVLYYTNQVFNDDVIKEYCEVFRTPEGEELLDCYGLSSKERKIWRVDFNTRLEADNLYDLIKDDLSVKDREKIALNKKVFLGVTQ